MKSKKHQLPRHRQVSLVERLSRMTTRRIILWGVGLYLITVLIFSVLECLLQNQFNYVGESSGANLGDYLYFNFITILTVGYGDLSPHGDAFRTLAIVEAFLGVGIFGLFISILAVKSLLPNEHSIVFSRYGYYCLSEEKFMIIFLNTSGDNIYNAEICSYFKLGGDWKLTAPVKTPFFSKSVQTYFATGPISKTELGNYLQEHDCLRVGMEGGIGMTKYSTSVQYNLDHIIVIDSGNDLKNYEPFWKVDDHLCSHDFEQHFHYRPENAKTMKEYFNII